MRKSVKIGLVGAILWIIADVMGTVISVSRAIAEGWFSYNITMFIFEFVEWLCLATLVFFIYTFKKRLN